MLWPYRDPSGAACALRFVTLLTGGCASHRLPNALRAIELQCELAARSWGEVAEVPLEGTRKGSDVPSGFDFSNRTRCNIDDFAKGGGRGFTEDCSWQVTVTNAGSGKDRIFALAQIMSFP